MKQAAALALCAILSSALTVNGQETSVDAHLGRVLDAINQRFDDAEKRIDQRFDAIDQRFEAVDKRLDSIETRLNEVESKVDHVSGQVDMAKWVVMALIALMALMASERISVLVRKFFGRRNTAYDSPKHELLEGKEA